MIKILLVDDQMILAEGIKSVLETCNDFLVCGIATDGAEAVSLVEKVKPDVVLMDIRMPVMNGYEATETIRKLKHPDRDLPIIAMTADAFADDMKKCLDSGMNAHIAKPIDLDVVKQTLAKFIKRQ